MPDNSVSIQFLASDDHVKESIDQITKSLTGLKAQIDSMAGFAKGMLGLGAIGLSFNSLLHEGEALEDSIHNLKISIDANGYSVDAWLPKLMASADALERITTHSSAEIRALQAYGLNLGVAAEKMDESSQAAVALSRVTNGRMGLEGAMRMLTIAQEGNWQVLRRFIPDLKGATSATQAWAIINDRLNKGFAEEEDALNTTSAAAKKMWGAIEDIKQSLGEALLPSMTAFYQIVKGVAVYINDWIKANKELASSIVIWVTSIAGAGSAWFVLNHIVGATVSMFRATLSGLVTIIMAPFQLLWGAISGAVALFQSLHLWTILTTAAHYVYAGAVMVVKTAMAALSFAVDLAVKAYQGLLSVLDWVWSGFKKVWSILGDVYNAMERFYWTGESVFTDLIDWVADFIDQMQVMAMVVTTTTGEIIEGIGGVVVDIITVVPAVVAIAAGIALVAAAAATGYAAFTMLKSAVAVTVAYLKEIGSAAYQGTKAVVTSVIDGARTIGSALLSAGRTAVNGVILIFQDLAGMVGTIFDSIVNNFGAAWDELARQVNDNWQTIKEAITAGNLEGALKLSLAIAKLEWENFKDWLLGVWESIKPAWNQMAETLAITLSTILAQMQTAWVDLWTGMKNGAIEAVSQLDKLINVMYVLIAKTKDFGVWIVDVMEMLGRLGMKMVALSVMGPMALIPGAEKGVKVAVEAAMKVAGYALGGTLSLPDHKPTIPEQSHLAGGMGSKTRNDLNASIEKGLIEQQRRENEEWLKTKLKFGQMTPEEQAKATADHEGKKKQLQADVDAAREATKKGTEEAKKSGNIHDPFNMMGRELHQFKAHFEDAQSSYKRIAADFASPKEHNPIHDVVSNTRQTNVYLGQMIQEQQKNAANAGKQRADTHETIKGNKPKAITT